MSQRCDISGKLSLTIKCEVTENEPPSPPTPPESKTTICCCCIECKDSQDNGKDKTDQSGECREDHQAPPPTEEDQIICCCTSCSQSTPTPKPADPAPCDSAPVTVVICNVNQDSEKEEKKLTEKRTISKEKKPKYKEKREDTARCDSSPVTVVICNMTNDGDDEEKEKMERNSLSKKRSNQTRYDDGEIERTRRKSPAKMRSNANRYDDDQEPSDRKSTTTRKSEVNRYDDEDEEERTRRKSATKRKTANRYDDEEEPSPRRKSKMSRYDDAEEQEERNDGKSPAKRKRETEEKEKLDWTPIKESNVPIVWLLGKPGTGKDTQAQSIVKTIPGFVHISTGDLLRDAAETGGTQGQCIETIMKLGGLVPNDIVQELLNRKMLEYLPKTKAFLIDGYPRDIEQADQFIKDTKRPKKIIYLDAPDDVIMNRLKRRGKASGRPDDNEKAIKKRIDEAKANDEPLLRAYRDGIIKIDTNKPPRDVFPDISDALRDVHPHVEFLM